MCPALSVTKQGKATKLGQMLASSEGQLVIMVCWVRKMVSRMQPDCAMVIALQLALHSRQFGTIIWIQL